MAVPGRERKGGREPALCKDYPSSVGERPDWTADLREQSSRSDGAGLRGRDADRRGRRQLSERPDVDQASPKAAGENPTTGHKRTWKQRLLHELKQFLRLFLYLWVMLALLMLHES